MNGNTAEMEDIMTGKQYKAALAALGMTQEDAAAFLHISLRTSSGYANGAPIPEATAKLLRLMIDTGRKPETVK
jgi:transcriptional regulator with XRE-family HTH domain